MPRAPSTATPAPQNSTPLQASSRVFAAHGVARYVPARAACLIRAGDPRDGGLLHRHLGQEDHGPRWSSLADGRIRRSCRRIWSGRRQWWRWFTWRPSYTTTSWIRRTCAESQDRNAGFGPLRPCSWGTPCSHTRSIWRPISRRRRFAQPCPVDAQGMCGEIVQTLRRRSTRGHSGGLPAHHCENSAVARCERRALGNTRSEDRGGRQGAWGPREGWSTQRSGAKRYSGCRVSPASGLRCSSSRP